ncbi:hypothetical protein B0H17DRAFT_1217884 [Mycena rosella]|uniref:Uncharacterized protein n=1 Tax=Mycena rosella TaxID=1033263 RepID=A0AAD7BVG7_MYCRO|nr:hypothetical protein B0H17DRAFT_1217884 [Mycena rosella]
MPIEHHPPSILSTATFEPAPRPMCVTHVPVPAPALHFADRNHPASAIRAQSRIRVCQNTTSRIHAIDAAAPHTSAPGPGSMRSWRMPLPRSCTSSYSVCDLYPRPPHRRAVRTDLHPTSYSFTRASHRPESRLPAPPPGSSNPPCMPPPRLQMSLGRGMSTRMAPRSSIVSCSLARPSGCPWCGGEDLPWRRGAHDGDDVRYAVTSNNGNDYDGTTPHDAPDAPSPEMPRMRLNASRSTGHHPRSRSPAI